MKMLKERVKDLTLCLGEADSLRNIAFYELLFHRDKEVQRYNLDQIKFSMTSSLQRKLSPELK